MIPTIPISSGTMTSPFEKSLPEREKLPLHSLSTFWNNYANPHPTLHGSMKESMLRLSSCNDMFQSRTQCTDHEVWTWTDPQKSSYPYPDLDWRLVVWRRLCWNRQTRVRHNFASVYSQPYRENESEVFVTYPSILASTHIEPGVADTSRWFYLEKVFERMLSEVAILGYALRHASNTMVSQILR